jgi:hypothetical protein
LLLRGEREIDGDLVLTCQIRVGDLSIWHLEGGAVRDIEGELSLAKIGFAPVPATQGMLLGVQIDAVPVLEDL